MSKPYQEKVIERKVTYTLEMEERVYIVENVPPGLTLKQASSFSGPIPSSTCDLLSWEHLKPPKRFVQTPVYIFLSNTAAISG